MGNYDEFSKLSFENSLEFPIMISRRKIHTFTAREEHVRILIIGTKR